MTKTMHSPGDVVVATVLPFHEDQSIDWKSYERVLRYCGLADGISAVFVNGHAGEGGALDRKERIDVLRFTREMLGDGRPLVAGIIATSTREAIDEALAARNAGASMLTVFPPATFVNASTAMVVAYVRAIGEASGLPLAIFQYPLASGYGYSTATLVELARLPFVVAIKEGSDSMRAYEETRAAVKAVRADLKILASNFDWFLAQIAVGSDGILSGLASLVPQDLVALWRAGEAEDLAAMRRAGERMLPLVRAIYAAPRNEMYARIKVALAMMNVIECERAREPFLPVSAEMRDVIRNALVQSGLIKGATP
ncbi:dihydrodipicolinate synthase family protein [Paraburkholderia tuberum]|uniref:4-hydroxy-tetrahydrodipicolinate synthase n=1 Tax=Paraburkholderia tuberum TaxID=157910 RepID=A0A1H1KG54_9BURK|nr:dihydrodipicolinate synthase family protein [Paraburkholderia tuberum]SDR61216.1 4-hydroxy-tetrahydrodipicolinate synthase [Paraburkholderia tuberum]